MTWNREWWARQAPGAASNDCAGPEIEGVQRLESGTLRQDRGFGASLPANACVEIGRPGRAARPTVMFESSDEQHSAVGDSRHAAASPFRGGAVKRSRPAGRAAES